MTGPLKCQLRHQSAAAAAAAALVASVVTKEEAVIDLSPVDLALLKTKKRQKRTKKATPAKPAKKGSMARMAVLRPTMMIKCDEKIERDAFVVPWQPWLVRRYRHSSSEF